LLDSLLQETSLREVMRLLLCLLLPLSSFSSHLTSSDKSRLANLFSSNLQPSADLPGLHYSILGSLLLGSNVDNSAELCGALAKHNNEVNVEILYQAAKAAAALGCPLTLGAEASGAVASSLGDGASTASIFFASNALVSTGTGLDSAKVSKALTAALKKDDSLLSLGLAFHTAALLDGDLAKFFDRIEDAVVQADEVDGKMLQFEGGLSVTSVVLTGAARLATKAKKLLPVTGEQAVKFANYLMSRKSVQQTKGAFHLLEAVLTMANNPQYIPLSVSLASPVSVSSDNPHLVVSVTDLAGGSPPAAMEVVLDSATRVQDGAVVAAKQSLVHMVTTDKYTVDLMTAASPPAGFYELVLSATPAKPDPRFVGNSKVVLNVKVLTTISVTNVELKITDADQSTDGRTSKLTFPDIAPSVSVDHKEVVQLTFSVLDSNQEPMLVHQAFVKMTHVQSGSEIIYVAEPDKIDDIYKFELDLGAAAADFGSKSGEYLITVVIGDAVITNPIAWEAAKINIAFPDAAADKEASIYEPKPEIRHLFREPEARPASVVSNAFTILCLSPILLMLGLWVKLGVNISNFPLSVSSVGFHLGLGSIFLLYTYFWLQLNMFQTVKYLVVLGVVTFLCGNSLLASIAKKTKAA